MSVQGQWLGLWAGVWFGKAAVEPPVVVPQERGGGRLVFVRPIPKQDQDDLLLLIAAQIAIGML